MEGDIDTLITGMHEARELRRSYANWGEIEKLPPRLKAAVKYYIETGDLYVASKIADVKVDEMREVLLRVGVPIAP